MTRLGLSALSCAVLCSSAAAASERVYQFRTQEDPSVTPDPTLCASAPFSVNVRLTASVWVERTRASDGQIVNDGAIRIGTAHGCVQLTNFTLPPGLQQQFYGRFDLPAGRFTGLGTCTIISNDVPRAGLILAACGLRLTGVPAGVSGGSAASSSVFNPFRLPGFATGSRWTLQTYDDPLGDGSDHAHHHHDMEIFEDPRTDDEIAAALGK